MKMQDLKKDILEISSFQNEKVKFVKKLRDKSKRDESKLFLIEGYSELLKAIDSDIEFERVFISKELFLNKNEDKLIEKFIEKNVEIFSVSKEIFLKKISYRDRPDGLLAIAKQKKNFLIDLEKKIKHKKNPIILIAEKIEKPGNLGTILRSSDGANVDAIVICDMCTDIFNPNVVRASIGSMFHQFIVEANSKETLNFLKKNNIKIVATTPDAKKMYFDEDLSGAIAIVVGSEQYGLSDIWLKNSDINVSIPMKGKADSLNVGAATTIVLYETLRQRLS